ncbi:hypothetical protein CSKR_203062 [Clonorchis sinensis]|uniref:Uncharacterized protein n=1 Tax=Clonorchis sinensis TaxID=79923 RepID=A0A8T1M777_CLOSI|nr:hypothetical protein CSKR_203062 [Clonorchis sinensis]
MPTVEMALLNDAMACHLDIVMMGSSSTSNVLVHALLCRRLWYALSYLQETVYYSRIHMMDLNTKLVISRLLLRYFPTATTRTTLFMRQHSAHGSINILLHIDIRTSCAKNHIEPSLPDLLLPDALEARKNGIKKSDAQTFIMEPLCTLSRSLNCRSGTALSAMAADTYRTASGVGDSTDAAKEQLTVECLHSEAGNVDQLPPTSAARKLEVAAQRQY